jgi:ribose-phosphate pyrophosphokinase
MDNFLVFAGKANPELAKAIAEKLSVPLAACSSEHFPDGEVAVQLLESVRQKSVFIVQSTSPPVNDHLMELMAFVDACRRSAADRITAIVPYFGYARADKRHGRREPITASMVAHVIQAVGIDHLLTLDLHTAQIEGFFHIPIDNLTAVPVLCDAIRDRLPPDVVVISPDSGRVQMATQYAQRLGSSVVVMHKQRQSGTETTVTRIVGDVRDRPCLIIDDMISTGGTLSRSIDALLQAGARPEITIAATHGLFIAGARERLSHEAIQSIFVTDSVAPQAMDWPRLQVVSVASLLASTLQQLQPD